MTNQRLEPQDAVYLGLGSNIGDRETHLRDSTSRIEQLGIHVVRQSSIYETEPVGFVDQTWFLNQVIEINVGGWLKRLSFEGTAHSGSQLPIKAAALLSELLKIEGAMGRHRTIINGPREIDVDLLLFGDKVINQPATDSLPAVVVPHPRMHLRRFVLEPLCEIAPELVHPTIIRTFKDILDTLDDPAIVRIHKRVGS
jgi:2-amino-4-hydroxy-6-hydroxymethyldihydropteridine diphosphokinase